MSDTYRKCFDCNGMGQICLYCGEPYNNCVRDRTKSLSSMHHYSPVCCESCGGSGHEVQTIHLSYEHFGLMQLNVFPDTSDTLFGCTIQGDEHHKSVVTTAMWPDVTDAVLHALELRFEHQLLG